MNVQLTTLDLIVIGERIVTPGAIVQLVFKLRLTPPTAALAGPTIPSPEPTPEERKKEIQEEDEREQAFLTSKEDADELLPGLTIPGVAHAPRWPVVSYSSFRNLQHDS